MTVAEQKVRELASKLVDHIETWEKSEMAMDMILHGVRCYLCGIDDGISLSEEMREPDYSVQAATGDERPRIGDGPHNTISGGPKTTTFTESLKAENGAVLDPKITVTREPNILIDERDLPWNFGRGDTF